MSDLSRNKDCHLIPKKELKDDDNLDYYLQYGKYQAIRIWIFGSILGLLNFVLMFCKYRNNSCLLTFYHKIKTNLNIFLSICWSILLCTSHFSPGRSTSWLDMQRSWSSTLQSGNLRKGIIVFQKLHLFKHYYQEEKVSVKVVKSYSIHQTLITLNHYLWRIYGFAMKYELNLDYNYDQQRPFWMAI